jgi:hypothetical protein
VRSVFALLDDRQRRGKSRRMCHLLQLCAEGQNDTRSRRYSLKPAIRAASNQGWLGSRVYSSAENTGMPLSGRRCGLTGRKRFDR